MLVWFAFDISLEISMRFTVPRNYKNLLDYMNVYSQEKD